MDEKCYFHKDIDAIRWREGYIMGEPERVPLCRECCRKNLNDICKLHELNIRNINIWAPSGVRRI